MQLKIPTKKAVEILEKRKSEIGGAYFEPNVWKGKTENDLKEIFDGFDTKWLQISQIDFDKPFSEMKYKILEKGKNQAKQYLESYIEQIKEYSEIQNTKDEQNEKYFENENRGLKNHTRMNKKIIQIEKNIDRIRIDGKEVPKKLSEFNELSEFIDFEYLKTSIINKEYRLSIPDYRLYDNFEYIAVNRDRIIVSFFMYLPYLIAIALIVLCLINEKYFGLLLLPLVFIGQYISAFFKNFIIILGVFVFGIYLMFNENILVGAILITLSVTLISSIYFKIFRRMGFYSSAMQSEKVFSFLFYSKNISLVNNSNNTIIRKSLDGKCKN